MSVRDSNSMEPDGDRLRTALGEITDQLSTAIDGSFNVVVQPSVSDDAVDRLAGVINRVLDSARQALAAQRAAHRSRDRLLADLSHEVRTPLSAVLGFAELIGQGDLSPQEQRSHLATVRRNGVDLMVVMDDILEFLMLASGESEATLGRSSPSEVVLDACGLLKDRAIDKGLAFQLEYQTAVPEQIATDAIRLRHILINLVRNAIALTEQGGIRVNVKMLGEVGPSGGRICFEVCDAGPGLTELERQRLFDPVNQADPSSGGRLGTTLGMLVSRGLAELLGGRLKVESELGRGSKLTLTLPTGSLEGVEMVHGPEGNPPLWVDVHQATETPSERLSGRILVADDVPDSRLLIRKLLQKVGLEVDEAENGRIALQQARSARAAEEPYDVILMDMQMPEMDGYEATRQLRAEGYPHAIVALTAHAMSGDRERCLAAGCDDFVSKPVNRSDLLARIEAHLSKRSEGPESDF